MKTFKQFIAEGKRKKALETLAGQKEYEMASAEATQPARIVQLGAGTAPNSPKRQEAIYKMLNKHGVPKLKDQIKKRRKKAEKAAQKQLQR